MALCQGFVLVLQDWVGLLESININEKRKVSVETCPHCVLNLNRFKFVITVCSICSHDFKPLQTTVGLVVQLANVRTVNVLNSYP